MITVHGAKRGVIALLSMLAMTMAAEGLADQGGTDIGGSGPGSQLVVSVWCRDSRAILEEAKAQADVARLMGDTEGAIMIMRQGFERAIEQRQAEHLEHSLTYVSLRRGLDLLDALDEPLQSAYDASEAKYKFVTEYSKFVLDQVGAIDLLVYIPYYYGPRDCRDCGPTFNVDAFEKNFVEYARAEVQWALRTFTVATPLFEVPGQRKVVPKWNSRLFLKVIEYVSRNAADDLDATLWKARFACVSDGFRKLNDRLARFNSGNVGQYTEVYMVQQAYADAESLATRIGTKCLK